MMFYRLIKPDWAKRTLTNGEPNPKFIKEIPGYGDVIEGCFDNDFISQKNHEGYNTYWFPNRPSENIYTKDIKFMSGKYVDTFEYVFVDMDLKDEIYASKQAFFEVLSAFSIKPSMVVNSGNGVHAYWKMSNLSREEYVLTQMALLHYFKTDPSVWTVLQLMRVPGSLNTKKIDEFKDVQIIDELSSNATYENIGVFPPEIFNIPEELKFKAQRHLDKLDGKLTMEFKDVNLEELPQSFLDLAEKNEKVRNLFEDPYSYGDRSGADMALANMLFNANMVKDEALQVLCNTQKALSKGAYRKEYAQGTIAKVYSDRVQKPQTQQKPDINTSIAARPNKFKNVGEIINSDDPILRGRLVNGPVYLDMRALIKNWRTTQVLGLLAGTGVGKTAKTLWIFKEIIKNNPENDGIFSFHTLEMPVKEIADRWLDLVGKDSPWSNRLYIIGNEDEVTGDPRNLGLQEIVEDVQELEKQTGKKVISMGVDHFGIIAKHIDTRKKYTFGILSEDQGGWGDVRTLSANRLATELKSVAKILDVFLIILSQTTKEKGVGDLPIGKDGAYGNSQFDNICDYIISIWQPLMRVHKDTPHRFLAYQYAKIRHKHKNDTLTELEPKLLTYQSDTGDLTCPTEDEYMAFKEMLPRAQEARQNEQKKQVNEYSRTFDPLEVDEVVKGIYNQTTT
tara:strand:+ start:68898 stop:70928 length:2031 start_codon:yes stop_codon:yes gene_type:complete